MSPKKLLDTFGIDFTTERGARLWLLLTWKLWAGVKQEKIMREIYQQTDILPHKAYAMMRRAMDPVFRASDEELRALGLERPETIAGLAAAVAASIHKEKSR